MAIRRLDTVDLVPLIVASGLSLIIYFQEALTLLLKAGEVLNGVFDTSVPAYPLVGMFFVMVFLALRRKEFGKLIGDRRRSTSVSVAAVCMALLPLAALFFSGWSFAGSYAFAGIALVVCWVGILVALRPSLASFLLPYLGIYVVAVGSVDLLTGSVGDPLAGAVAAMSSAITTFLHIPVQWSSTSLAFVAAGGQQISLYVSQECSGIASISVFLLLMALMHLDVRPTVRVSIVFAVGGSLLFLLLNAVRVVMLIEGGILGGEGWMWNLHGWVGYPLYIFGYTLIVLAYMRLETSPFSGQETSIQDPMTA